MADHTQSISFSVNCFGAAPSSKWGSGNMTWGVTKWGEGTNQILVSVGTFFSESQTQDDSFLLSARSFIDAGSVSHSYDQSAEYLLSGNGYYYVFPNPVTNAESRSIPSYTSGSQGSVSWASQSVASQTWSETNDA